ncbi:EEF1A lysine methyltransferase 2-like isoform X5 [Panulirus ornatus]|uniref:EEF1A lysine methyltransferase 2-like isoform X5 n=1 Tax=Panulirus ornatus TaxID=150431 RepID=UPI003A85C59D
MSGEVEELPSSKLGTKEYWDSAYDTELSNYAIDGDIGEIWFGEESLERVISWMLESNLVDTHSVIIDVGCGNGAFLLYLAAEGFTNLYGIDYSQKAIELAQAIATKKKVDIKYEISLKNISSPLQHSCLEAGHRWPPKVKVSGAA